MNISDRRILFYKTLEEGLDHKTVLAGTDTAIERLTEARRIARDTPRLEEPLAELASYRLAHARLRKATSVRDFYQINELLEEAIRPQGNLSIMPRILQLAVHQRLSTIDPESDPEVAQEGMDAVWNNIITAVKQTATNDYRKPVTETNSLLQSAPLNMAELAAYFTGCNLAPFDGAAPIQKHEDLYGGLSGHDPFVVCANDDPVLDIDRRIPQDIAMEMVKSRLDRGMADIGFVIDEKSGHAFFNNGKPVATQKVVLVFGFVLGLFSREQIKLALNDSTLTIYRKRLNGTIAKEGVAEKAVRYDRLTKTYSFAPELRIVSAVSRKLLHPYTFDHNWGKKQT